VKSAEYMYNFSVDELITDGYLVSTLSASGDGYLLVSAFFTDIYTTDGSYIITLNSSDGEPVHDAAWTPGGDIVCTTANSVLVLSITGDILTRSNNATWLSRVSVSQDGDIYVTNKGKVLLSSDGGVTWSVRFSALDNNSYVKQAIKVSSDQHSDIFWTLEFKAVVLSGNESSQLYMYTLYKTADNAVSNVTRSDVTIPTDIRENVLFLLSIAYDGKLTIFALDFYSNDVFMWSVDGTYYGQLQLILLDNSLNMGDITWLAVDSNNQTMYASLLTTSIVSVGVFSLTYDYESS
jgi:hypothetical protein